MSQQFDADRADLRGGPYGSGSTPGDNASNQAAASARVLQETQLNVRHSFKNLALTDAFCSGEASALPPNRFLTQAPEVLCP